MSYLDHVIACNRYDPDAFLPFRMPDGARIGFIRRADLGWLDAYPEIFIIDDHAVSLRDGLGGPAEISGHLAEIATELVAKGVVPKLRNELFDASLRWSAAPLFQVDRAAVPFFGIRGHGSHLNGIIRQTSSPVQGSPVRADDLLWIGQRAADKKVAPNKFDNIVAGGISAGYDARETLLKEAEEEAGMPEALAALARPVGAIRYRFDSTEGLRDDVLFVYDLDLPQDFEPEGVDGEFAGFHRLTMAECMRIIDTSDQFKFNVNLVVIDLAIRHGLIDPSHADYLDIVVGLRGGMIKGPY